MYGSVIRSYKENRIAADARNGGKGVRYETLRSCEARLEITATVFPMQLVSDDILRDFYKPIKPENKNQKCDFCNRMFERKLL